MLHFCDNPLQIYLIFVGSLKLFIEVKIKTTFDLNSRLYVKSFKGFFHKGFSSYLGLSVKLGKVPPRSGRTRI